LSEKQIYEIFEKPELESSTLVVGWSEDAGRLGPGVVDYLNQKLGAKEFAEVELEDFFPLGGVSVQDDVARFPEIKFHYCPQKRLVTLKSNSPRSEWYRFMETVLDIAQNYCHASEIYTIGGMVYFGPHTTPRQLMTIVNSAEMRESMNQDDLIVDLDYETPPGQRPTLNSFLIWCAMRRGIAAASLWVPVPFYLVAGSDPRAWKKVLEFLDNRLSLEMDLRDVTEEAMRQNEKIAHLRSESPEVDGYIEKLETSIALTQEESEQLVKEVDDFLKRGD